MLSEKVIQGLFAEGKISKDQRDRLLGLFKTAPKKMSDGGLIPAGKPPVSNSPASAKPAPGVAANNAPAADSSVSPGPEAALPAQGADPVATSEPIVAKDATIAAGNQLKLEQAKTQAAIQATADIQDAVAKVGYAKAVASVYDQELQRQSMIEAEKARLMQDYVARHESIFAQIADKSIDPNRWWKNRSTGDKVLLSVGAFLAGLGGGENQVLRMIQNAIDSDIRAQVADLQRVEMQGKQADSIYKAYKDLYGDQTAASLATKEAMLRGIEAKISELELPMKNEIQKLQLQKLRAEIESLRLSTQEKLKSVVMASPEYQSKLSTVEKIAQISDSKLKDAAMKEYEIEKTFPVLRKQVQDAFNEAASFNAKRTFKSPDADQRLRTALINAYEAVTGNDIKQNEKAISAILGGFMPEWSDTQSDIKEKQMKFEKFLVEQKNARTGTLQSLGIISPEFDRSQFKKVR